MNSSTLKEQKEAGVNRKLVGFELAGKGIPRQGYDIVTSDGVKIGNVTSGTMGPSVNKGIGMGYVDTAFAKADTEIFIQIRKKTAPATVVKTPFYKK